GAMANAGEQIGRVRIISGANTIVSNGVLGDPVTDVVVMDDFIYAEPLVATVSGPATLALAGLGGGPPGALSRRRRAPRGRARAWRSSRRARGQNHRRRSAATRSDAPHRRGLAVRTAACTRPPAPAPAGSRSRRPRRRRAPRATSGSASR